MMEYDEKLRKINIQLMKFVRQAYNNDIYNNLGYNKKTLEQEIIFNNVSC